MMRILPLVFAFVLSPAAAHDASNSVGAPAKTATRVVAVDVREADGAMLFSPDRLDVAQGERVRFVVHNAGALAHEFVIGTKAANKVHAAMMSEMPGMQHHDANAISVAPGATASLTWRFAKAGTFEFACLLPGHYAAGMHGAIAVR